MATDQKCSPTITDAHTKVICSPLMLYYGLFMHPKKKYSAAFLKTAMVINDPKVRFTSDTKRPMFDSVMNKQSTE